MSEAMVNREQLATIVELMAVPDVVGVTATVFWVESTSHCGLGLRFERATTGQYVTLVLDRHGVPVATSEPRGTVLDAARKHLGLGPIGHPKRT